MMKKFIHNKRYEGEIKHRALFVTELSSCDDPVMNIRLIKYFLSSSKQAIIIMYVISDFFKFKWY